MRHFTTILIIALLALVIAGCSSKEESPSVTIQTPAETPSPTVSLPAWTGDPVVQTLYGEVQGFEDESETWVWKAVPYAEPPIGDLRWRAPKNPTPWEGVRAETEFCDMCPQFNWITADEVWGNEDCLYLNIWRPKTEETNLPVYVYIHGGGNAIGNATQVPTYYGHSVASKSNMIFVSMNYRLGPFGWFTHPALRTGDLADNSGNYGTLDLIKSLEWIHENIEAFGGDPDTVIITGESSGGSNVLTMMESPLASGLFHTALIQSCFNESVSLEKGESHAQQILLKLLVNDGTAADQSQAEAHLQSMSDAKIAVYLRTKTAEEILACYEQREFGEVINPNVFEDGYVIIADGAESIAKGTYPNKVPVMIGSTREELKMFLYLVPEYVENPELYQAVTSYGADLWKAVGVDDVARQLRSHADQPDVYVYRFNWGAYKEDNSSPIPAPYDLKIGTAHTIDQAFFLGNPVFNVYMTSWVFNEENRPGREALTYSIMSYVAQFARTGDPNKPALPKWEPWTNEETQPKCILLDAGFEEADIEMSPIELTVDKVLENLKSEVPEPLYSEVFEVLSTYRITADLVKFGSSDK